MNHEMLADTIASLTVKLSEQLNTFVIFRFTILVSTYSNNPRIPAYTYYLWADGFESVSRPSYKEICEVKAEDFIKSEEHKGE